LFQEENPSSYCILLDNIEAHPSHFKGPNLQPIDILMASEEILHEVHGEIRYQFFRPFDIRSPPEL
jgi:hypothetical protein